MDGEERAHPSGDCQSLVLRPISSPSPTSRNTLEGGKRCLLFQLAKKTDLSIKVMARVLLFLSVAATEWRERERMESSEDTRRRPMFTGAVLEPSFSKSRGEDSLALRYTLPALLPRPQVKIGLKVPTTLTSRCPRIALSSSRPPSPSPHSSLRLPPGYFNLEQAFCRTGRMQSRGSIHESAQHHLHSSKRRGQPQRQTTVAAAGLMMFWTYSS
ncbi:hypothetical protein B0O80DRAFT_226777 [Mortierella sp. GBAus27b]|nr:hypothetical protein B0O80DRAFT_226777 [Mortierella sp. GBAus27b]